VTKPFSIKKLVEQVQELMKKYYYYELQWILCKSITQPESFWKEQAIQ
jgi:membrane-bound lytic murein transglycosylase MltF